MITRAPGIGRGQERWELLWPEPRGREEPGFGGQIGAQGRLEYGEELRKKDGFRDRGMDEWKMAGWIGG